MYKRNFLRALTAAALAAGLSVPAAAADTGPIKIGLILPMTGQQASTGRQIDAAVKLYMAQNNPVINGRKVEVESQWMMVKSTPSKPARVIEINRDPHGENPPAPGGSLVSLLMGMPSMLQELQALA